ncbi:hypothetical protein [Kribbella sp. CA-293567]|uniref:hypothetical protein n=1 Tax=Kribbella sp. CA-293567 TaxID=3002436 RepID=UPI0022DDE223|nr:hypothetical protein [Kribbella sp. CA-293567]WBQ02765.1 hypothetical protein OX958_22585 [Kribbella sp. CA-293567]
MKTLDNRRSRAFATLNDAELNAVYVTGSSPWSADRALLASYRKDNLRIEGLRFEIDSVTVESASAKHAVLRIVDRLISGVAITPEGQRTTFPTGSPTPRRLTLTATGTTWRISAISTA